jgi:hypothetical protein
LETIDWLRYGNRGLAGGQEDYTVFAGRWTQSTVNLDGTPWEGSSHSFTVYRGTDFASSGVAGTELVWTKYFLLGNERYTYRKGDLDPYLNLNPQTIVKLLDPKTLRDRLTQRRILAIHAVVSGIWELDPLTGPASYYTFPSMGGESPARAYGGRRIMDKRIAGVSADYRWPIWKYLDGTVFAEVAWSGDDWVQEDWDRWAPGVGFGLRARTPKQFLFRGMLAYGKQGPRVNLTVDPEF